MVRQRSGISAPMAQHHNQMRGTRGMPGNGSGGGDGGGGDTYVTTVGYEQPQGAASRLGNSLKGLLFGPFIILLGCILLWNNEKWAIKTHRALNEALEAFVAVDDALDANALEAYRGKLIHLTHKLSVPPEYTVRDPIFGLERANVVSLRRDVEIFQWVEKISQRKVQRGKETEIQEVVNYQKKWQSAPVDSNDFRHLEGHENYCCDSLPMESESFDSGAVAMGAYSLGNALRSQLDRTQKVSVSQIKTLPEGAQKAGNAVLLPSRGGAQAIAGESSQSQRSLGADAVKETIMKIDGEERTMFVVKATGESFSTRQKAMTAAAAAAPPERSSSSGRSLSSQTEIGDVRITFEEIPCTIVSVLAKLSDYDNSLGKWRSKQGSGYDVAVLHYGSVSPHDMVASEQSNNNIKTWLFRAGGWLFNLIGFYMITDIITTSADLSLNWIPLLGPMTTSLINLGVSIANFIMAGSITMLVASIAWIVYRPLLGCSLLVGSIGLFFGASQMGKNMSNGPAGVKYNWKDKE